MLFLHFYLFYEEFIDYGLGYKVCESYMKLSISVVAYCGGIPLALIVLGCFLFGRSKEEWESALEDLELSQHEAIFNVLKLSFDGLNEKQKNIFLDLICFFGRRKKCLEGRYTKIL